MYKCFEMLVQKTQADLNKIATERPHFYREKNRRIAKMTATVKGNSVSCRGKD